MGNKKTIRLVEKVLLDENRRKLYTPEELQYMSLQLLQMKINRKRKQLERKQLKGFNYDEYYSKSDSEITEESGGGTGG